MRSRVLWWAVRGRSTSAARLRGVPMCKEIVVLDTPLAGTGQCAEGTFAVPECKYDAQRGVLRCKG